MSKSSRAYVCLLLAVGVLSSLSYAATADRIMGTVDSSNLVELKGHVSLLARPQYDQGPVQTSQPMRVTMLFLPTAQQEQALKALLAEQQDEKSPNYHKWLTVAQYADQFGLSTGDIQKVSAWLEAQGFKVTYVANGSDFLSFSGTAGQVQSVFRTQIDNYNVNGKMHFANVTSPMIPAALIGIVGGFRGMHNFFPHSMLRQRPNYTFEDGGNDYTAIAPGDIATLYDIKPLYNSSINGSGQNVVIAGQSDVYLADINYFRGDFGLTQLSGCTVNSSGVIQAGTCTAGNFQQVWPDNNDPGLNSGDLGESDLDIETMSGVARGANIIFVTSGNGVDDSVSYAVDQNPPLAKVISYSYGLCEPLVTAPDIASSETVYQKAVGLGISIFAASGDSAASICDGEIGQDPAKYGQTVSYPASSAYVTAVGGTEFDEGNGTYWGSTSSNDQFGGSALSPIPESAWNDTGTEFVGAQLDGTGGGPSNCAFGTGQTTEGGYAYEICDAPPNGGFPKPTWQSGVTPADSVRDVPDISFSASNVNDPFIVCAPQSEVVQGSSSSTSSCVSGINTALTTYNSAFGGTSASTPITAGMAVLLNQYLGTDGVGLFNTQLYKLFGTNPLVFNQIESGTNSVTGGSSSNVVPCTDGDPSFEPLALRCSTGTIGYTVPATAAGVRAYSEASGLGSVDINAFIVAWGDTTAAQFALSATPNSSTASAGQTTSPITITETPNAGFTSTVTFTCPGTPTGVVCVFSPASVTNDGVTPQTTSLTIQTLPNIASTGSTPISIEVTGTGGGGTTTSPVALTVTPTTESFTLTATNTTYTVTPGQTATVNVTVASTNGFLTGPAGSQTTVVPLTYTCTDPASESLCTISSQTTNATTVSFSITTTAPTGELRRPLDRSPRIFYAALLPGLFGILFTAGSRKRSLHGVRMLGLIMMLGFSTLWLGSCGGSNNSSSSNPGTATGNYTITISATTGGASPLTAQVTPAPQLAVQ